MGIALFMHGDVASAQSYRTVTATRTVNAEDSLHVRVTFVAGRLRIAPSDGRSLYQGELYYDEDKFRPDVDYDADDWQLEFGLEARRGGFRFGRIERPQRLDLALAPQIPLRMEIKLGAAEANVELGGMSLVSATIGSGASETQVTFSRPNRVQCRWLILEAGVAEFRATDLGNSRCEQISFEGGVGDVTLDFGGDWSGDANVNVDVRLGLGQLTLRLPRGVGIAIDVERFLASFNHSELQKRGDRYVTEEYDGASARLDISIKAALGDIDVQWIER